MKILILLLFHLITIYLCDLPIHCIQNDIIGEWKFSLGETTNIQTTKDKYDFTCFHEMPSKEKSSYLTFNKRDKLNIINEIKVYFKEDSTIELENSNIIGKWTMLYDEGIEFIFDNYFNSEKGVFFIFMRYDKTTNNIENREYNWNSYCYSTLIGWYHIGDNHWGCFYGNKLNVNTNRTTISNYANLNKYRFMQTQTYSQEILSFSSQFKSQTSFVAMINNQKLSWKAKVYKALNDKTLFQINSLLKNKSLFLGNLNEIKPKPHKYIIQDIIKGLGLQYNVNSYKKLNNIVLTEKLPKHFNWLNYLSEPKEQGDCGSCYAMSLVSSLEARFRIKYENELKQYAHIFGDDLEKFELSTQHVIKCSYYNQGCDGGFSFSVGKFFKENEIYLKECFDNQQTTCVQQCKTNELNEINNRLGVNDYYYIGGAYGKANETNIMNDLYINGPLVISLEPEPSFASYSNGIYTGFANKYKRQNNESQFQKVSHSVLLVGWGEEEINNTTMKYWVIQNSWGTIWGKHGFAKILRGYNLGNIESIGEAVIPHFK